MIIKVKIDVTKIEKQRLFEGKNGAEYLDATILLNDHADQYGNNGMVVQDVSKDERQKGVKGTILGNVKIMQQNNQPQQSQPNNKPVNNQQSQYSNPNDDLPF